MTDLAMLTDFCDPFLSLFFSLFRHSATTSRAFVVILPLSTTVPTTLVFSIHNIPLLHPPFPQLYSITTCFPPKTCLLQNKPFTYLNTRLSQHRISISEAASRAVSR